MNAILREDYEAPVLTLEAIEAHLSHMQPDLSAVKAALPVLRDKIDDLSSNVDSKIDQANRDRAAGDAMLAEKIDQKFEQLSAKTDAKIDQANTERAAGDATLAEKIDQANKDRAAGDAMLAEKIDQANRDRAAGDAALAEKIDQLSTRVDAKFDQFAARFDAKIDQANKDRAAGDAALAGKIDHVTERVLEIQGTQKGLVWFITSVTLIAAGASIAHSLGWI